VIELRRARHPGHPIAAALLFALAAAPGCGQLTRSLGDDAIDAGPDAGVVPADAGDGGAIDSGGQQAPDAQGVPDAGTACGLRGSPECRAGQFCRFESRDECGAIDRPGECLELPDACDGVFDPVCGCDDRTHPNECEAHRRGVSVHYRGPCGGPSTLPCGGRPGMSCPTGMYCEHEAGCAGPGVCRPSDQVCPREFRLVCGCDGQSYPNACIARAIGTDVARDLPCSLDPATARDCQDSTSCAQDEFCDYSLGDGCDATGGMGICRSRNNGMCPFFPVCGCDGVPYPGVCPADAAGMTIRYRGRCMLRKADRCRASRDWGRLGGWGVSLGVGR
jgi:hypothetical protein